MKKILKKSCISLLFFLLTIEQIYARAGGGGSSSGGGGSSSSSGGGSSSVGSLIFWLIILSVLVIYGTYKRKKHLETIKKEMAQAAQKDSAWNEESIKKRVEVVFYTFQKDWSDLKADSMKNYLMPEYHKRMALELFVLKNEGRKNLMNNVKIKSINILEITDKEDNNNDTFVAEITASADDILFDERNNKILYKDSSQFTEYWYFKRNNDVWKLDIIKQSTVNQGFSENNIEQFAQKNDFYYDEDFGWLMMPNQGVIFCKSNFKTSDINNHVIGYFRNKVVEFYTFRPHKGSTNYVVAQTILPKSYKNIFIKKKKGWFNFTPSGLQKLETESIYFNEHFCLWAHPEDQVNSLELLTPVFMEKIYNLPFEINIEIVNNFLYFYAENRKNINYDEMLAILSWAFDEMER